MSISINKTLLDLDSLINNVSYADTVSMLSDLTEAKDELNMCLVLLRDDSDDMENRLNEIFAVEEQIEFLNKNIKVIESSLQLHESKLFEKTNTKHGLAKYCLN